MQERQKLREALLLGVCLASAEEAAKTQPEMFGDDVFMRAMEAKRRLDSGGNKEDEIVHFNALLFSLGIVRNDKEATFDALRRVIGDERIRRDAKALAFQKKAEMSQKIEEIVEEVIFRMLKEEQ